MGAIREIKVIGRKASYELSVYVDEEDYQTLKLWDYSLRRHIGHNTTYVSAHKNGKAVLLHRLLMGLENGPTSIYVDHIDFNGLNNSRTNLRLTDNSGNTRNKRKYLSAKTSSVYKGVSFDSNNKTNPWRAYIRLLGKLKHLGFYRTQEEAAMSYNKAAIEHFGDMANPNILGP